MNFYRNSQSFEQNVDNLKGPRSGPWTRLQREGSEGSEGSEGKVDGASPRRFLRFLGLTALRAEGCGIVLSGDEFYMPPIGGSKNRTTGLRPLEMHPFWCCAPPSPPVGGLYSPLTFPPGKVILSRRRRISVPADSDSCVIKCRSAGSLMSDV